MKIIVINREPLEHIPPLVSAIIIMRDLGYDVEVISRNVSQKNRELLEGKKVKITEIPYEISKNILIRMRNVLSYRRRLKSYLSKNKFDMLWIEGAGTFRTTIGIVDKYPFIMQISELFETDRSVEKAISTVIHKAKVVVMPEYNRAVLYQVKYGIDRPIVLPNKPYFSLSSDDMKKLERKYSMELESFTNKKVILYQGGISKERDLTPFIKAINSLSEDYLLVLLGKDDGMVKQYKSLSDKVVHIDYIPMPEYLVFTSKAYIGIVSYDPLSLNCEYCAPNKIYEYGMFGLPIIGNDLPGLRYTIGLNKAGIIVDINSEDSILRAIKEIENNYDDFSSNAKIMYDKTDNVNNMYQIITKAMKAK